MTSLRLIEPVMIQLNQLTLVLKVIRMSRQFFKVDIEREKQYVFSIFTVLQLFNTLLTVQVMPVLGCPGNGITLYQDFWVHGQNIW